MSDSPLVPLRNTVSGVIHEFTAEEAEQYLTHPVFGSQLEVVTNDAVAAQQAAEEAAHQADIAVVEANGAESAAQQAKGK